MIRAVVDTSILLRALLKPQGTVGPILDLLEAERYRLLYSAATLEELVDVLGRPRLRRRFPLRGRDIETVVDFVLLRGDEVEPGRQFTVCRDPKDDKFLDVAVAGKAHSLVTGDKDLLVLHPFEGIPVVRPVEFIRTLDEV